MAKPKNTLGGWMTEGRAKVGVLGPDRTHCKHYVSYHPEKPPTTVGDARICSWRDEIS